VYRHATPPPRQPTPPPCQQAAPAQSASPTYSPPPQQAAPAYGRPQSAASPHVAPLAEKKCQPPSWVFRVEGREVDLRFATSLVDRIEALRGVLEEGLGVQPFMRVYDALQTSRNYGTGQLNGQQTHSADSLVLRRVEAMLPGDTRDYLLLVKQLCLTGKQLCLTGER
jgi:hypothetical protein